MRDVDGILQAIFILQREGIVTGARGGVDYPRGDDMVDHAEAEIDLTRCVDKILQVFLEIGVADIRGEADIVVLAIDPDLITILAGDERCIEKKAVVKKLI